MAIAITAPWGMGKSSMMIQLRDLLAHPPPSPEPFRRWSTVEFPAWKFERSERLWAGLAKAIYEQPLEQMGFWKGLAFRWRLERKRLGLWKLLLKFGWPVVAAGAAVAILLNADLSKSGTTAAGLATLAAIAAGVSRYWDAVSNPFKQAIERYASTPDYEAQLGFTSAADEDIRALGEALCPTDRDAVAVFVDDLDRCGSEHVVEVVGAMNQIFASERERPYVFILGLDREMVSTSIRVAYRDVVDELAETNAELAEAFGTQFLSKLVQLSMTIAPAPDSRLVQLLESVGAEHDEPVETLSEREIERVERDLRQDDATLEDIAQTARQPRERPEADAAVREAATRQAVSAIRESPDVFAAEVAALRHLERNPRQVKRFHNAFRLQLYVASFDGEDRFDFRPDHLHALAKWVALRLRWPDLADADDREPLLLSALEAHFNSEPERLPPPDDLEYLKDRYLRWFEETPALRKVLFERDPERRISALSRDAFVETA